MSRMKVFISHATTDRWVARQVAAHLDARGIDTFLDEKDIETGDSIDDSIQADLADCDELLMLLSPASLTSTWVLIEVGGAKALQKRLVPILLHVGANDLPGPLANGLAREINDIERYYDEIEARSKKPRGRQQEPTASDVNPETRWQPRSPTFKPGDFVYLPREPPARTYSRSGTDVGWNAAMEQYLGLLTKIESIHEEHGFARVDADGMTWAWLLEWLAPAVDAD
jgi:TIR domain